MSSQRVEGQVSVYGSSGKHVLSRLAAYLKVTAAIVGLLSNNVAWAQQLPTGGTVAAGAATIGTPSNGTLNINQSTNQAVINWNSFSVGRGGTVNFNQPNSSSATLNRVTGATPSWIAGTINAPGTVLLVNPNGIAITKSGVINTGSFAASTLDISNPDFMAGNYKFTGNGGSAAVRNAGRINVSDGGFAALLGGQVANSGVISARLGKVGLGAGELITLDLAGDGFLSVAVPSNMLGNLVDGNGALVTNSGKIRANGGQVFLSAATATTLLRDAVNVPGSIRANTVGTHNGRIVIGGGDGGRVSVTGKLAANGNSKRNGGKIEVSGANVALNGKVSANGKNGGTITVASSGDLAVSGTVAAKGSDGQGGRIDLTGANIKVIGALIDASGTTGGGLVRIGGTFQGGHGDPNDPLYQFFIGRFGALPALASAQTITIDAGTKIDVSAKTSGDGGTVVVWSDQRTAFAGTILASGGAQGGNGGFVETSGKQNLAVLDTAYVNTLAPNGVTGNWLLDPKNIIIAAGGSGTFTSELYGDNPTLTDTLDPSAITGSATGVTLQANNDITINAVVNMTNAVMLTLNAGRSIFVNANVTSRGGFTATINDAGATTANRDSGKAAFTMAAGTTISTAAATAVAGGAISITTGTLAADSTGATSLAANIGDITLASLNSSGFAGNATSAGGAITVTNSQGNILSVAGSTIAANGASPSSGTSIAGGAGGTIQITATNGSIGSAATPFASVSTKGGNGRSTAGSGGNGGAVTLTAGGNIWAGAFTTTGGTKVGAGTAGTAGVVSFQAPNGTIILSNSALSSALNFTATSSDGKVTIQAAADGTLTVSNAINWTSATTLVLSGTSDVTVNASITSGSTGTLLLTSGGELYLQSGTANVATFTANARDIVAGSFIYNNASGTLSLTASGVDAFGNGTSVGLGQGAITANTLIMSGSASGEIYQMTGALNVTNLLVIGGNFIDLSGGNNTNQIRNFAANTTARIKMQDNANLNIASIGGVDGVTANQFNLAFASTGKSLTQSALANITANEFYVVGSLSTFVINATLTNAGNNIGKFAASVTSTGSISLSGINGLIIATLQDDQQNNIAIGVTAGTLTLSNTGTVTQTQKIATSNATGTNLVLLGTGGNYVLTSTSNVIATLAANTGSINVSRSAAAALATGTVGSTAGITTTGNVTLTSAGAVTVGALGAINAGGAVVLTTTGAATAITLNNSVTGVGVTLNSVAPLTINKAINAGSGNVSLNVTGAGNAITQSASGVITANTLLLSTNNGSATLNAATIAIANLGTTTLGSGALNLFDVGGLTVIGAVGATGGITINIGGALAINNTVNAGAGNVSLTTAGAGNAITQSAGGAITANTLALSTADGNATLDTATNAVSALGNVSIGNGALALKTATAGGLAVPGASIAADGGIAITNTTGGITTTGGFQLSNGAIALTAIAGNIVTGGFLIANGGSTTLTATNGSITLGGSLTGTGVSLTSAASLTLNANIFANSGNLLLTATGAGSNITQTAGRVQGAGLLATALNGSVDLTAGAAINAVATIAGRSSGNFAYTAAQSTAFTIGTVSGTSGIISSNGSVAVTLTNSATPITVSQAVTASNGDVTLSSGGNLTVNATVTANTGTGTISLASASGAISQNSSGVVTGNTLTLSTNGGNATLNTATNAIANLGTTTLGAGSLNLLDAGGLTVTGAVGATGGITLNNSGALTLNGNVNAGTGNVSLTTTGAGNAINQTGGGITAGTLTLATNNASVTLNSATNAVTNLGAASLGNGTLSLTDTGGLTVTGAVGATGGVTINTSGVLAINNTVNAGAGNVSLTTTGAGNAISQNSSGVLTGNTLTLSTNGGDATLNTATNAIANLGTTTLGTGALNLLDAGGLTVTGAVGATGGITLNTSGALAINGNLNAGTGNVSLTTTGAGNAIGQNAPGLITANTLSLATDNGEVDLRQPNGGSHAIANLGTVTLGSGRLVLPTAGSLTVTGAVGATGGIYLFANNNGVINIQAALNAGSTGDVNLAGPAGISQTSTGIITAKTLFLSTTVTGADLSATNNVTNLGNVQLSGGSLTFVDAGGLTITGVVNAGAGVTVRTTGGDLAIATGGLVTSFGANAVVVLSTDQQFINAGAVGANGRWLVYSAAPAGNTFGGLDSGNAAIWNATYATLPPGSVTQPGNRYIFAQQPTLTFTSTGTVTKTYGDDAAPAVAASSFTVSGLQAVANAFTDTASSVYSGAPGFTSNGSPVTADVAGSPYSINGAAGGLASLTGYAFAFVNNGTLTVTPATLTATANAASRDYGDANPALSGSIIGFKNGQNAGTFGGDLWTTLAGLTSNVGSYGITGGLTNASPNYTITQVAANSTALTVNKATLTFTANTASRNVGDANPALTGSIAGFKNGQNAGTFGGDIWSTLADQASPAGNYAVAGTLTSAAPNYRFTQAAANLSALTVNAAPPTVPSGGTDGTTPNNPSQFTSRTDPSAPPKDVTISFQPQGTGPVSVSFTPPAAPPVRVSTTPSTDIEPAALPAGQNLSSNNGLTYPPISQFDPNQYSQFKLADWAGLAGQAAVFVMIARGVDRDHAADAMIDGFWNGTSAWSPPQSFAGKVTFSDGAGNAVAPAGNAGFALVAGTTDLGQLLKSGPVMISDGATPAHWLLGTQLTADGKGIVANDPASGKQVVLNYDAATKTVGGVTSVFDANSNKFVPFAEASVGTPALAGLQSFAPASYLAISTK